MRSPNGDDDWWRRLSESEVDPISHASLSSLPYPPFNLGTDESHATYFDGFVLSNYLVSTGYRLGYAGVRRSITCTRAKTRATTLRTILRM
jgi:hypothetical protein